jgi:hypothetical protein
MKSKKIKNVYDDDSEISMSSNNSMMSNKDNELNNERHIHQNDEKLKNQQGPQKAWKKIPEQDSVEFQKHQRD